MDIDLLLEKRDPALVDNLPPYSSTTAYFNVRRALATLQSAGVDGKETTHVIDCDSSAGYSHCVKGQVPCMTRSRAAGH
eukprot:9294988-Karenia_brevis.AAC.1